MPAGAAVPRWARSLRAFLAGAANGTTDADREVVERCTVGGLVLTPGMVPVPVQGAVEAFAPAVSLLRKRLNRRGAASSLIAQDLLADLAQRLLARLGTLPLQVDTPDGPKVAEAWGELLNAYPAAGRCLGALLGGYIGYSTELCRRLEADVAALAPLAGAPAGTQARAVGCRPGAGDLHAGARSVTIVELEGPNGQLLKAVYKPRDLSHVAVLAAVVRAAGLDLRLPACLLRDNYGWEEFVEPTPASTPEDLEGAARELGSWALVFHLLGTSDLLAENVRICGPRVVPIDVEAMFTFRFSSSSGARAPDTRCSGDARPDLSWEPPGSASALFSAPLLRRPGQAHDAGLLAGHGRPLLTKDDHVVAGYADAAANAGQQRQALQVVLARAAAAPVRAIVRNTQTYETLLDQSLQLGALVDGVARDLTLEPLWAAHLHGQCPARVVQAEIAALRRLDVPAFTFAPGTTQISALSPPGTGGWEQPAGPPAQLTEPPIMRAARRIAALGPAADPAELDALRAAMFCAAENHRGNGGGTGEIPADGRAGTDRANIRRANPNWPNKGRSNKGRSSKGRSSKGRPTAAEGRATHRSPTVPVWGERAAAAAAECATWVLTGGPKGATLTAGLSYVSQNDSVVLSPRRAFDLFSGSPGMAVALASLARSFGQPTVAEAAEASIADAVGTAWELVENFCAWTGRGAVERALGWAYGGVPGLAVLCASTGSGALALRRLCEVLAAVDVAPRGALDAVAATTAALRSAANNVGWTRPAADRAGQLLRDIGQHAVGAPARGAPASPGHPRFVSNVGQLVPSEGTLANWVLGDRADGQGAGCTVPVQSTTRLAGSGDRLVAAAICPADLQPLPSTALAQLSDTALVAEVEVCLVAARHRGIFRESAEVAGSLLVARRDAGGRWFSGSLAPDRFRLSAVWGALACAHVLAGLANPACFSSIRLFEAATA